MVINECPSVSWLQEDQIRCVFDDNQNMIFDSSP